MSARALRTKLINYAALPYKSPLQPYVSWATMFVVSLVILFSGMLSLVRGHAGWHQVLQIRLGFDVFVKGNFTAAGFLTCYLNVFIFIGTYYTQRFKSHLQNSGLTCWRSSICFLQNILQVETYSHLRN